MPVILLSSVCIVSFNLHNNFMILVLLLLSSFYNEGMKLKDTESLVGGPITNRWQVGFELRWSGFSL